MAATKTTKDAELNAIDWGALTDAYGDSGTELRALLLQLPDTPTVLAKIEDRISHQGTVAPEVAIAAIPVLVEQGSSPPVVALLGRLAAGGRDELGFPSHAKVRAAVRTHVETIGEAFASAEPALRAAGAYALVLADALTPQQRGRLLALSRDEAEPASLLASLARLDAKNHVEVFRRAAGSNDAVRRVGGHVGLALAGASTDADIEAASRLPDDAMSEALWFWDGGDPRRTLVSATTTLGARAVKAVFDHLAADPARDRLTATLLDAIPEAESTRAVMSDGAKADLIWLAMHESAFSGPNVRFALAARGLPCNPLHLRRSLGLEPASSLDTVRLTLDGETLSVREHWRQRCQRDASDEALGELVRALTSAMSGEDIVAVLPELVFVEGTWGSRPTARRSVCLPNWSRTRARSSKPSPTVSSVEERSSGRRAAVSRSRRSFRGSSTWCWRARGG